MGVETLNGHTYFVICIHVVSETRIVSGSSDGTLRIWDKIKPFGTLTQTLSSIGKLVTLSKPNDQWKCTKILAHKSTVRCLKSFADQIVSGSDSQCI